MAYQSVNPFDGKIIQTFEELTDEQLDIAIENAVICFEFWSRTPFAERAAVVARAAAILDSRVDSFAHPVTMEMGKLIDQAREFLAAADKLKIRPQVTVFSLDDANQALVAVKEETAQGSIVIVP
jgi:acyl-CoA reductase-like NAD-dependent aldehyde dehydrogenase